MNNDYLNNDYLNVKIDCFQSLLLMLLEKEGLQTYRLGSIVPWQLILEKNDYGLIKVHLPIVVSDKKIFEIFGVNVVRKFFRDDIRKELSDILKKTSIIVNIDQFHVPHHYTHIYKKKHGQHSLLLTKYNDTTVSCIDLIPDYNGEIEIKELVEGIKSFPENDIRKQYLYLEKKENMNTDLKMELVNCINKIFDKNNKTIFHLYDIIEEHIDVINEEEYWKWLDFILMGRWLWNFDRPAKFFLIYLENILPVFNMNIEFFEMKQKVEKINNFFFVSLRKLYACSIKRDLKKLREVINTKKNIEEIYKELLFFLQEEISNRLMHM